MARFVKADVVVIPFPFSDLSDSKKRPALVLASLDGDDVILCQLTSKASSDDFAIPLTDKEFVTGGLNKTSNIRPNRIFTADENIIIRKVGTISISKMQTVVDTIIEMLNQ